MLRRFERGFSLMELLVVLALMAAMLVILIPAFFKLMAGYRLQSTANIIATNLRFARNAALKQKVKYSVTFNDSGEPNPNTYIMEYWPANVCCQPVKNMDTSVARNVEIEPASLDQVTFDSRGAADVSGSILLSTENIGSYTITVSTTGAVNMTKTS
jgi:prepilin-type N-terminal cleavage/methylation domain-containing protein